MMGLESVDAAQLVVQHVQDLILTDRLHPGDRLPPERHMTEQLGVGRPAVREALKALELMGVLERRQGSGNYIAQTMSGHFFKPLSLAYKLGRGTLTDVLRLRQVLEDYSVGEACKAADGEGIRRLREVHESLLAVTCTEEAIRIDRRFHFTIAQMSGNQLLVAFLDGISYLLDSLFSQTVTLATEEDITYRTLYDEHQRILEGVEQRDAGAARMAMTDHFAYIDRSLERESEEKGGN